jgi:putative hydrolase of the HAD superfamily
MSVKLTPMTKTICFDFDGTLAHFTGDFVADLKESAVELGLPESLHEDFIATYLTFDKSCRTFPEAIRETLATFNMDLPENLEGYCKRSIQRYVSQIELLPGAQNVLEHLTTKNIPLAIITNGTKDIQSAATEHVNIQHYFKSILISGEVGVRKPDARIFKLACERLNAKPENCLMVGDKLDADVEGAKAIGMQAAWMSTETTQGVLSFENLAELETWLQTQL